MENIIIIAIVSVIVICAVVYIVKSKKNGEACIGCPHSKQCSGNCHCDKNN